METSAFHIRSYLCVTSAVYIWVRKESYFFFNIMSGLQSSVLSPERSLVVYTFEILPSALLEGGRK